jgi:hypothetical protein
VSGLFFPQRTIGLIGNASTAAAALHSLPKMTVLALPKMAALG